MHYSDYQHTRNLVWHILLQEKICALPVRISVLCRNMGIAVKMYYAENGLDGYTLMVGDTPVIFINGQRSIGRQRFTAAHELGHIMLGHVGLYQQVNRDPLTSKDPLEQAANAFAVRLLAPACVLWGCGVKTAAHIVQLCDISQEAAEYRMKRLRTLYKREKFLSAALERKVFEQFSEYIAGHQL